MLSLILFQKNIPIIGLRNPVSKSKPTTPHSRLQPSTIHQPKHPPSAEGKATVSTSSEPVTRIAGLPAVTAIFKQSPERILRFFYEERMIPQVGEFCARMAETHRPYRMVNHEELTRIAGTVLHGGVVAVAEPPSILPLTMETARQWAEQRQPLFLLDGIGNTHNLGAIARTLAFFGFKYLLLSDHPQQAGLSDSAHRVAEGGLEYLQVYRVAQLPLVLKQLQAHYRIVGTALRQGASLEMLPPDPRPMVVVMGNEEVGLSPATLKVCEAVVTLRGSGTVQSLNVSATMAILAYYLRQQNNLQPRQPKNVRSGRVFRKRSKLPE
jgi:TrmH RNA methyltransferase